MHNRWFIPFAALWRNFAGSWNRELRMETFKSLMMERSVGKVRKKLPVGIENFREFSTEDFYYVDKTMFIKELLLN